MGTGRIDKATSSSDQLIVNFNYHPNESARVVKRLEPETKMRQFSPMTNKWAGSRQKGQRHRGKLLKHSTLGS